MIMKKFAVTLSLAAVLALGAVAVLPQAFAQNSGATATAKVEAVKVGAMAPDFTLTDTAGSEVKLSSVGKDKIVVLEWFNPECPFVVKQYAKTSTMIDTHKKITEAAKAKGKEVVWLAVNSGAPGKQGAGKELNAKMKTEWKISWPILLDESGSVGKSYGAKTTPHMYVIDTTGKLVFAGAIDNNRSADKAGDVNYVVNAVMNVLDGKPVAEAEPRSYGCSVKYGK
jgi:peroxiredoxin